MKRIQLSFKNDMPSFHPKHSSCETVRIAEDRNSKIFRIFLLAMLHILQTLTICANPYFFEEYIKIRFQFINDVRILRKLSNIVLFGVNRLDNRWIEAVPSNKDNPGTRFYQNKAKQTKN